MTTLDIDLLGKFESHATEARKTALLGTTLDRQARDTLILAAALRTVLARAEKWHAAFADAAALPGGREDAFDDAAAEVEGVIKAALHAD